MKGARVGVEHAQQGVSRVTSPAPSWGDCGPSGDATWAATGLAGIEQVAYHWSASQNRASIATSGLLSAWWDPQRSDLRGVFLGRTPAAAWWASGLWSIQKSTFDLWEVRLFATDEATVTLAGRDVLRSLLNGPDMAAPLLDVLVVPEVPPDQLAFVGTRHLPKETR